MFKLTEVMTRGVELIDHRVMFYVVDIEVAIRLVDRDSGIAGVEAEALRGFGAIGLALEVAVGAVEYEDAVVFGIGSGCIGSTRTLATGVDVMIFTPYSNIGE